MYNDKLCTLSLSVFMYVNNNIYINIAVRFYKCAKIVDINNTKGMYLCVFLQMYTYTCLFDHIIIYCINIKRVSILSRKTFSYIFCCIQTHTHTHIHTNSIQYDEIFCHLFFSRLVIIQRLGAGFWQVLTARYIQLFYTYMHRLCRLLAKQHRKCQRYRMYISILCDLRTTLYT